MNKLKVLIIMFLVMFMAPLKTMALEDVDLYLFYSDTCPHCHAELEYLEEAKKEFPSLTVHSFEISSSENNAKLYEVADFMGVNISGVPFTVIGNVYFSGFDEVSVQGGIQKKLKEFSESKHSDPIGNLLGITKDNGVIDEEISQGETEKLNVPFIGEVSIKNLSIPALAVVMGFVDGFNPCAMWILLFLISMLLGMKDRKRMWYLGSLFILTSGFAYFVVMAAWVNALIFLSAIAAIQIGIGLCAIFAGSFNLWSFSKSIKTDEDGCEVANDKKRSKIIEQIKTFTNQKSLLLASLGIMALAISVNILELFCSLGLPVMFTNILAQNDISSFGRLGYILLYDVFFMLDDIVIFAIAMTTLKLTGVSTKYTKYSKLVGGLLMVIIGLILIFNPSLLTFS